MGKCPKCGKKTTSWLELEYCDACYSEDDLDSYKLLDEIDWLKQKTFRIQYDCDQCQARHIKDKDDLNTKLAESEEKCKKAYREGLLQKQFDKDMEIEQLKQELALTEKALELACKNSAFEDTCDFCEYKGYLKTIYGCPCYCETEQGFELEQAKNYFITKAKEMMKSE